MKIDLINKSYLILFALLLPLAVWAEAKNPNIILIMADDLGVEGLGCYGGTSYSTPRLDRLAAERIRFQHAYSQSLCTNTRVQVMTAKYNHRNWLAFGLLDPREKTIVVL
jgi:arylsulfatase A-like enzyme